jgi:hypothetical protein
LLPRRRPAQSLLMIFPQIALFLPALMK